MNWARNRHIGLLLSFWMLWSSVGIKLYLEYCACHEAIQASLFEPATNSCPSPADLVLHWEDDSRDHLDQACCTSERIPAHEGDACCQARADLPDCPPGGCDSQDVQEYRVTSPFLLSVQDWPVFSFAAELPAVPHLEIRFKGSSFSLNTGECLSPSLPAGREFRIRFQSFLC